MEFHLETARPRTVSLALSRRGDAPAPLDVLLERYPYERRYDPSAGDKRTAHRA